MKQIPTKKSDDIEHSVWLVIPAAGVGKRMQSDVPKQYIRIHEKTVLEHTLACFTSHSSIAGIVIALHADDPYWKLIAEKIESNIPIYTVEGGAERCDSVLQALDYLSTVEQLDPDHWVMVHDAARPCVNHQDIDSLLALLAENDLVGGILATPVKDTMKRANKDSHTILKTEKREDLWHALTPQMFRLTDLQDALEQALDDEAAITDEASAMERLGEFPILVKGSSQNIKITLPEDVELASWILASNTQSDILKS